MSKPSIAIHLPDGSVREVPQGTTPLDIANELSPRLAAASVVARLTPTIPQAAVKKLESDGQSSEPESEADMSAPNAPRRASSISPRRSPPTRTSSSSRKAIPTALKVVRHSAAHVLATAVLELFPENQARPRPRHRLRLLLRLSTRDKPFTPEDLARDREEDGEVVARNDHSFANTSPRICPRRVQP